MNTLECALLGKLIENNSLISQVNPDWFEIQECKEIYNLISNSPERLDLLLLLDKINNKELSDFILDCYEIRSFSATVQIHINKLKENYLNRQKEKLYSQASLKASKGLSTLEEFENIKTLETEILTTNSGLVKTAYEISNSLIDLLDNNSFEKPIELGYTLLAERGELILLGATTGMGKTALALNIALNLATNSLRTHFLSLEMSNKQLMQRVIAILGKIPITRLRQGDNLTQTEWQAITNAQSKLYDMPFFISDKAFQNLESIETIIIEAKKTGIDVLFIDYLQLIETKGKYETRNIQIGSISRKLKLLAKEYNIIIIALSQLSRGVGDRNIKVPLLSDLRDSGSLEQDADQVYFLHRPEVYEKTDINKGDAEIHVAKNRQGSSGNKISLHFEAAYNKFI